MSDDTFSAEIRATLERWHAVSPPNDIALAMAEDLDGVIRSFESFRGRLGMEEEPAFFMVALIEAAGNGAVA